MTQAGRDRLAALNKAKKKLITQSEAAEELELSIRQVQRLLEALQESGEKAVVQGLRGKPSNRRIEERIEKKGPSRRSMTRATAKRSAHHFGTPLQRLFPKRNRLK